MDSKIILGRILQRFIDTEIAQVAGYNQFGFIKLSKNSVVVSRERDTIVPFSKIIIGIETYQKAPDLYEKGPTVLRAVGITHVTSPVFALLHLLLKSDY
jgi:hypothetical protein